MSTRQFGQPVLRKEDPRLVTGNGRYLDDLGHTAHEAAFVRSPHAHARIKDIDVEGALDVEGVVAIFTHEDLEGPAADRLGGATFLLAAGAKGRPEPRVRLEI